MTSNAERLIAAFAKGFVSALLGADKPTRAPRALPRTRTVGNQGVLPGLEAAVREETSPFRPPASTPAPSEAELDRLVQGMSAEDIEAALQGLVPPGMRIPSEGEYIAD